MNKKTKTTLVSFSMMIGVFILLNASEAHAKGFAIINTGDDISHVADVNANAMASVQQSTGAAKPAVGYMYSRFGVFWLNIWTWNGKYVLFENDTFWDVTPEQAAAFAGVTPDKLGKPFFYSVPPGLVVLLLLVIGFLVFTFVFGGGDDDDEEEKEEEKPAEE